MKKIRKKILSCLLVVSMLSVSVATSAFAADNITTGKLNISSEKVDALNDRFSEMSYDELKTVLISEFGASYEEAVILAGFQTTQAPQVRSFPANPNIGDVHKESYTIHISLDATIASLAAAIVTGTKFITLAKALTIAAAVLALGSEVFGKTVKVTISYTYGYNNDGVLGWTSGYSEYEIV